MSLFEPCSIIDLLLVPRTFFFTIEAYVSLFSIKSSFDFSGPITFLFILRDCLSAPSVSFFLFVPTLPHTKRMQNTKNIADVQVSLITTVNITKQYRQEKSNYCHSQFTHLVSFFRHKRQTCLQKMLIRALLLCNGCFFSSY